MLGFATVLLVIIRKYQQRCLKQDVASTTVVNPVVSLQNVGDIPRLSINLHSQGVGSSLNLLEPSLSQRKVTVHSSSP